MQSDTLNLFSFPERRKLQKELQMDQTQSVSECSVFLGAFFHLDCTEKDL